ncbi:MAG: hypothetical protein ACLFU3_07020, partial [Dichotomicrobium sp.]
EAGRPAAERLTHPQIVRAATAYNAQSAPDTAHAALAHRLYNDIAYHLSLHYRYAGTRVQNRHGARPTSANNQ